MFNILRVILLPVIPFYYLVIKIRNWFFDLKLFKQKRVNADIISIGNITVGGSGKTPLVIYITELLKSRGRNTGVLSRGYGRISRGYLLVSDGSKPLVNAEKASDEMYLTVEECSVPGAVCSSRVEGAGRLMEDTGVDTIVLDDGFQHRWIARDIDILIFEQRFLHTSNKLRRLLLPTGNLREPFSSARRADLIVINRKLSEQKEITDKLKKHVRNKNIFTAYYRITGLIDVKSGDAYEIKDFHGQKSLLVSGIANPYSFVNALKQNKIDTSNRLFFRDHNFYTRDDIEHIRKIFYQSNSHSVITTQKDAVKLKRYSKELDDIDIYYLKIELVFDEQERFDEFVIKQLIEKSNSNSNQEER